VTIRRMQFATGRSIGDLQQPPVHRRRKQDLDGRSAPLAASRAPGQTRGLFRVLPLSRTTLAAPGLTPLSALLRCRLAWQICFPQCSCEPKGAASPPTCAVYTPLLCF
jgi:hypothetical protein